MLDFRRFTHHVRPSLLSTIYFTVMLLLIILVNSFMSSLSLHSPVLGNKVGPEVVQVSRKVTLLSIKEDQVLEFYGEMNRRSLSLNPPVNVSEAARIAWFRSKLPQFDILKSTETSKRFGSRVESFFNRGGCRIQVFMTWISPAGSFGVREFLALESLFQSNPEACLVIVSRTLDTPEGSDILKPLTGRGLKVSALSPDLSSLFKNSPAEKWFEELKSGKKDPGEIPLAQNLSNLIRLAVLYKYGGVYLDTDFIILKDMSRLRNLIGAQSTDQLGNWTRLNNAVLIFDKGHPLLYKFMNEFALTFDGNKWGHNGPYLVSRVVEKETKRKDHNLTVLSPMAFYPVDWTRIGSFFEQPKTRGTTRWVEAKLRQLSGETYGIHLWNKQSRGLCIQEGSIMSRLILRHCIVCKGIYTCQKPESATASAS